MAVLQLMLVAFVGMASACTTRGRNGQPAIDSGSVDIPIRLQFQQGPVPSASVSVGIESKMNQKLPNGGFKQTQFNGGFELEGAAVPVLDENNNVHGLQADLDTRLSHDNRVVYLTQDPMLPTQKPHHQPLAARQPINQAAAQVQKQTADDDSQVSKVQRKPLREFDEKPAQTATQDSNSIGGLKLEYFIAIMCVSGACFLTLIVVMVIVARKKQQVIEVIQAGSGQRRHHSPSSHIYASPVFVSDDQKPPSYDSEYMKSDARRSSSSDFEKKY